MKLRTKIIALFLFLTLVFSWNSIVIAEENNDNIPTDEQIEQIKDTPMEKPQEPTIDESLSVEEKNILIDEYNTQVDEYNDYATKENEKRDQEYNEQVQIVDEHNQVEQEKVEQNQQDLTRQEKLEAKIVADSQSKTAGSTNNGDSIPTTWEENTEEPVTISVEQHESTEFYDVINLHIFVNENASDTYNTSSITKDNFKVNIPDEDIVLGEWECVEVGNNDIVTVSSQAKNYPNSGALFLRRLEGYTNGYWMPTQEFVSTVNYVEDQWDENGPSTAFSYNEGTTDNQSIKNILNIFVYNFLRHGAEPTPVEEYTPDYWNYPEEVTHLDLLTKLERLEIPSPTTGENSEPEPEPLPKEEEKEEEVIPKEEEETTPEKEEAAPKENPPLKEEKPISEDFSKTDPPIKKDKSAEPIVDKNPVYQESSSVIVKESNKTIVPVENLVKETENLVKEIEASTSTTEENQLIFITPIDYEDNIIENNITETKKETQIKEDGIPLAEGEQTQSSWALLNLIAMIVSLLSAIKIPKKEKDQEEEKEIKRHNNIPSVLLAIGSVIIFILTEDVKLPIILVDSWTPLMLILAGAGIVSFILTRDKEEDKENEE